MDLLQKISDSFWNEDIWLPHNITWKDIEPGSSKDTTYPDYRHLFLSVPISIVIIITRYVIQRLLLVPIGKSLGVNSRKPKPPVQNKPLEAAYKMSPMLDHKMLQTLCKRSDLSERQVQRWWKLRKAQEKPTILVKFCENGWKCIHYTFSFSFGMIILWDKPWLWDFIQCFINYPHHSLEPSVWWYYIISTGLYLSLTFTQFFDVKRKDFWQMLIHHLITLTLISLSWICNFHRVGSLVLLLHDCADIPLEGAKFLKYAKLKKAFLVCITLFVIFWIFTRLVIFPRIIYVSSIELSKYFPIYPVYFIFDSMLVMLQVMHLVWTYWLAKYIVQSFKIGDISNDLRSDSESELAESS